MRNFHDKNAIHKFRSVGRFYDQGHFGTLHKAIHAHRSSNSWELELEVGDVIESKDYCSNGSSIGKNFKNDGNISNNKGTNSNILPLPTNF